MNATEAHDVNTVLAWAMDRRRRGRRVGDATATAAGQRLAAAAHRTLADGLLPRDVDLVRAAAIARFSEPIHDSDSGRS